jgi:hypothetical protein
MKLCKLEKVVSGENPIVRLTFKTWTGKIIVKDAFKIPGWSIWMYMDTCGSSVLDGINDVLKNFHANNLDVFFVNGENNKS